MHFFLWPWSAVQRVWAGVPQLDKSYSALACHPLLSFLLRSFSLAYPYSGCFLTVECCLLSPQHLLSPLASQQDGMGLPLPHPATLHQGSPAFLFPLL